MSAIPGAARRLAVRIEPQFGAVDAGRAEPQWGEKPVEVGDRAAADQRQGAARPVPRAGDGVHQAGRNRYVLGALGEVEQRPVDVEKQGDPVFGFLAAFASDARAGRRERCPQSVTPVPPTAWLTALRGDTVSETWQAPPERHSFVKRKT